MNRSPGRDREARRGGAYVCWRGCVKENVELAISPTCSALLGALIAEAYYRYRDKNIPYHLRFADLDAHRDRLTARRIIVTHMSADVLDHQNKVSFEPARDGLVITL